MAKALAASRLAPAYGQGGARTGRGKLAAATVKPYELVVYKSVFYKPGAFNIQFQPGHGPMPQFTGQLPTLGASTTELRTFLKDHAHDPKLWPANWSIRFRRVKPEPAPTSAD